LKSRLDLPDITPKPPCPRRVYAKVLGYLSSVLAQAAAPAAPPPPNVSSPAAIGRKRSLPERSAPTPEKRARQSDHDVAHPQRQQQQETGNKSKAPRQDGHGGPPRRATLPAWTTRFARALCASASPLATGGASRAWLTGHVVAGLETVVASSPAAAADSPAPASPAPTEPQPPRRRGRPPGSGRKQAAALAAAAAARAPTARLAALALAVAGVAVRAAAGSEAGLDVSVADALVLLEDAGAFPAAGAAGEDEDEEDPRPDAAALRLALSRATARAEEEGWLGAEWADNVRAVAAAMQDEAGAAVSDADAEGGAETRDAERDRVGLAAGGGGGEMLLFAEDWLSADRRRGFAAWRAGILSRIEVMEQQTTSSLA
jgi:origin recognition complex subunit 6